MLQMPDHAAVYLLCRLSDDMFSGKTGLPKILGGGSACAKMIDTDHRSGIPDPFAPAE